MYLNNLKIIQFRNYHQLHIDFHPKLNIFVGDNAQGKTNILEAIYLSSTGKSFRTNKDRELIKFDKEKAYIKVDGKKKYTDITVEVKLEANKKKQIKVNGMILSRNTDILDNIYTVIFSPEDLKLVKEGPSERRKFIDMEISQIKPRYFHNLNQYYKVLIQRNNLLKKIHNKKYMDTLEIWNDKLVELGSYLIHERSKFVQKMMPLSRLIHRKITENKENLEIKYIESIPMKNTLEETIKNFKEQLKKSLEEDIQKGTTTMGPHRDDLGVFINGMDIRNFGSQGQQRTSALSLKLAEIELIKGETSEYPILLLDDVMSELDINRQKFLIQTLKDVQIFITTTEISYLNERDENKGYIFSVKNAKIQREEI
ncbi:DNA replication/repair protein RecF [Anaerophilus nitritogenes]|uniref:DNA replication/repair protein RecF n=1 Tax=Anaerophilus nitritogenes TaxID=2498136 RepID=UPI00101D2647|nr:DNA replication/repair protein RecF [Anaerophilus nitritogenes]